MHKARSTQVAHTPALESHGFFFLPQMFRLILSVASYCLLASVNFADLERVVLRVFVLSADDIKHIILRTCLLYSK